MRKNIDSDSHSLTSSVKVCVLVFFVPLFCFFLYEAPKHVEVYIGQSAMSAGMDTSDVSDMLTVRQIEGLTWYGVKRVYVQSRYFPAEFATYVEFDGGVTMKLTDGDTNLVYKAMHIEGQNVLVSAILSSDVTQSGINAYINGILTYLKAHESYSDQYMHDHFRMLIAQNGTWQGY